ncbi:MAG TPA: bacteriohopanetetrol glucosamine biosynthesis glycosyltransferase HpnI [Candidatus Binatia bacterium]|nr:bacteriohopanetetrol glucosamine biosynthesis glycosyltransferase HpnI [Candidatus Binatia bacterium]
MPTLATLVIAVASVAIAYQVFQLFAARRFFRRAPRAPWGAGPLPAVTVLKPLKGPGIDLYENLASFCRLDYPTYQLVFGVEDPRDPAVAVVQQLRRDFPDRDIVLSVGAQAGTNRKVANLRHMMRHARHDVLVMSDSDIRVRPDYLRAMVAPLADPAIGLTTCLYRGVGRFGLPTVLESLFINTDFIPMVLAAQLVQRFEYAYGASIAFRRDALDRIGGFAPLADYLADDYQLGNRIAKAGYRLVLLPYVVETVLDSVRVSDVWRHLLRWGRTYRVCQPVPWFATIVTHTVLWGILAALATRGSALGLGILVTAFAVRLAALAAIMRLLGETETRRHLWLVPAKDLFNSLMWAAAFLGREVDWSGQRLRVAPDGRMMAIEPVALPTPTTEPRQPTAA